MKVTQCISKNSACSTDVWFFESNLFERWLFFLASRTLCSCFFFVLQCPCSNPIRVLAFICTLVDTIFISTKKNQTLQNVFLISVTLRYWHQRNCIYLQRHIIFLSSKNHSWFKPISQFVNHTKAIYTRVANVVAHHDELLTQWRHI